MSNVLCADGALAHSLCVSLITPKRHSLCIHDYFSLSINTLRCRGARVHPSKSKDKIKKKFEFRTRDLNYSHCGHMATALVWTPDKMKSLSSPHTSIYVYKREQIKVIGTGYENEHILPDLPRKQTEGPSLYKRKLGAATLKKRRIKKSRDARACGVYTHKQPRAAVESPRCSSGGGGV